MSIISTKKEIKSAISKVLSPNDAGETGGHQAGILIPKSETILSFFPSLGKSNRNPRTEITFFDVSGQKWNFVFIYYNNRFFGGTRNEYRLTGMTKFIRQNNLQAGDKIILINNERGGKLIRINRQNRVAKSKALRIGTSWKVVQL